MTDFKENALTDGEAKYNSSLDILKRINGWFYGAGLAATESADLYGLSKWARILHKIERELKPYMNADERAHVRKYRVNGVPTELEILSDKRHARAIYGKFYEMLDAYETTLGEIHASKNMGIIAKEKDQVFIISGG